MSTAPKTLREGQVGPFTIEAPSPESWLINYPVELCGCLGKPEVRSELGYTVKLGARDANKAWTHLLKIAGNLEAVDRIELPEGMPGLRLDKHDHGYVIVYGPALAIYRRLVELRSTPSRIREDCRDLYGDCLILSPDAAEKAITLMSGVEADVAAILDRSPPEVPGIKSFISIDGTTCFQEDKLVKMYWTTSLDTEFPKPDRRGVIAVRGSEDEDTVIAQIRAAQSNADAVAKSSAANRIQREVSRYLRRQAKSLERQGIEIEIRMPWLTFKAPYVASMGNVYKSLGMIWMPNEKRWSKMITDFPDAMSVPEWLHVLHDQLIHRRMFDR